MAGRRILRIRREADGKATDIVLPKKGCRKCNGLGHVGRVRLTETFKPCTSCYPAAAAKGERFNQQLVQLLRVETPAVKRRREGAKSPEHVGLPAPRAGRSGRIVAPPARIRPGVLTAGARQEA